MAGRTTGTFPERHPEAWAWAMEQRAAGIPAPAFLQELIRRADGESITATYFNILCSTRGEAPGRRGARPVQRVQHEVPAQDVLTSRAQQKMDRPGLERSGDNATVTSDPTDDPTQLSDIPAMLRARNLDPDDWEVERAVVNEWQSAAMVEGAWREVTLHQMRIYLRRKPTFLEAARTDGPIFQVVPRVNADVVKLYAILPDQQAPHHDPALHNIVCRWLALHEPDGIILSGDAIDLPTLSRHKWNPRMVPDPMKALQQGLDVTYGLLRDYVQAAGPHCTERVFIPGNHEQRAQSFLIEQVPQLYGVRQADIGAETPSVLSLPFLLRLDELGYDWVTGETGEWPQAEHKLSSLLAVRHGWLARGKSGSTAHATLDHLGYSCIVGHTHRQSIVFQSKHEMSGQIRTTVGVEAGTLATVRGGLGYAVQPDWQPGFAVARVWDDGRFHVSLATYVNGSLMWEGERLAEQLAA